MGNQKMIYGEAGIAER